MSMLMKDDKVGNAKRSGLFSVTDTVKNNYSEMHGLSRMDIENKPSATDYSVNNIDRIQQRIQSILGKR